jgi:hypothetical protein
VYKIVDIIKVILDGTEKAKESGRGMWIIRRPEVWAEVAGLASTASISGMNG